MPAWLLPAAAMALQAAPEINKFIVSRKQKKAAEKLGRDYPRPERKTSEYYKDYLTSTANEAYASGLPGESGILNQLRATQGNAMRSIAESQQSPATMMAGFLGTQQQSGEQMANLGVQAAQYRASQLPAYYNALNTMGQQDMENWDWNTKQPYVDAMGAKSALENASMRNSQDALVGLANTGINGLAMDAMGAFKDPSKFGDFMGNKTGAGAGIDTGSVDTYDYAKIREDAEGIFGPMTDDIFMRVYMPMFTGKNK